MEHRDLVTGAAYPLTIAGVVFMLMSLKRWLRIRTWKGRFAAAVTEISSGAASGYILLISLPYWPIQPSAAAEQILAIAGFMGGYKAANVVIHRLFGFNTREEDKRHGE